MAKYELLLPKMGESVAEATVIKWLKKPGDYIAADEAVMEIATDKVDSDVPSPVSGKLSQQFYQENDVVQVGAVIAIIETEEPAAAVEPAAEDTKPVEEDPEGTEEQPAAEQTSASAEQSDLEAETPKEEEAPAEHQDLPGMDQLEEKKEPEAVQNFSGRFYSPLVKNIAAQEGINAAELDKIPGTGADSRLTKDDLLNYLQTRHFKATAEPAPAEPSPETKETADTYTAPAQPVETISSAADETMPGEESESVQPKETNIPETVIPAAEEPAHQLVAEVPEPAAKAPVEKAAAPAEAAAIAPPAPADATLPPPAQPKPAEPKPAVSVSGGDEIIEMDRMRRLIADHMVYSMKTSPHVTSFVEADVTHLVEWRQKVKDGFEKREGEKITFTPIFIEAVVRAIKEMPMINVSVEGTTIIKKKNINISMATALPSGNLIVPVIKKADELSLLGITKAVNDLAARARTNKLLPDDVKDGTFTITNVGSFGNLMGTPIINQPQVAILAVGAIKKKPAVIETPAGDFIGIRHMMFLSLSYDHRVVDGALGGSFLRKVADYLEAWDVNRSI